jgi:predicted N-acyltransferase
MTKRHPSSYAISWIQQLSEIDRDAWDALAKPLSTPFLEWDWLRLMETSGSVTAKTGWLPHHLTLWSGENLAAVAPMYVKGHSAGEFVFDHVWADVAGRMGIKYYPKLVGMSPFTPMSGYRFLIAAGEDELELTAVMVAEIDRLCRHYNMSGSSFLFVDPQWHRHMLFLLIPNGIVICSTMVFPPGGIKVMLGRIKGIKLLTITSRFLIQTSDVISSANVRNWKNRGFF